MNLTQLIEATVSWHLVWLWLWFLIGIGLYMLKRAYYMVTGPNPIANSYSQFVERCWIPLLVRSFIDSVVFWAAFNPSLLTSGLNYLGWSSFSGVVGMVTQFAPMAFFFGMGIDSIIDFAVSKISWLNNWLPQMPGPLPTKSPTDAQAAKLLKDTTAANAQEAAK
jgi:hypothetical protein